VENEVIGENKAEPVIYELYPGTPVEKNPLPPENEAGHPPKNWPIPYPGIEKKRAVLKMTTSKQINTWSESFLLKKYLNIINSPPF
jgi:hypothetical protein